MQWRRVTVLFSPVGLHCLQTFREPWGYIVGVRASTEEAVNSLLFHGYEDNF